MKLNHPSIVKFKGYSPVNFNNKQKTLIMTEIMPNGSLDKLLEAEKENHSIEGWNDTKKLINIYGIAHGMVYLHSMNILHQDLKPHNIFLDEFLFPKIGDFDSSDQIAEHSRNSNDVIITIGSPLYCAPEVIEGKKSKLSDVFSFSILIYQILLNNSLTIQFLNRFFL